MAAGNSWQVFQELDSVEPIADTEEDIVHVLSRELTPGLLSVRSEEVAVEECVTHLELDEGIGPLVTSCPEKDDKVALKLIEMISAKKTDAADNIESMSETNTISRIDEVGDVYSLKNIQNDKIRHRPEFLIDPCCPIHGHKRARFEMELSSKTSTLIRRKKSSKECPGSGVTMTVEDGTKSASSDESEPLAKSDLAKQMVRKQKLANLPTEIREKVNLEKYKIGRNLFVVSVAFLFVISAFQGLQNLQLSLNGAQNLGAISLVTVYVGSVASCLFLPPYLLNRLGCKLTLVVCMCVYSLYMLVNFVPRFYSMIPGSLLLGVAAAPLWAAKCTYLTETGFRYATLNCEPASTVIVRFFGIFFMIVHLGQVIGNTVSSSILMMDRRLTSGNLFDGVETTCGHYFVSIHNLSAIAQKQMSRPPTRLTFSLYGAYFCCTLIAILVVIMFVDPLYMDTILTKEKPRFKLDMWNKTLQHMKKPMLWLLIPLTIFNGMEQSFIAGEFTKVYVACCLGIHSVGFVMACFGAADAFCSLFFGPLIKLFGRMPLLMFAAVVDMLMIFTLLIWPPNPADTAIFYVIAVAWGMADAVWNTQINGLWAVLFTKNLELAFANYRLWEAFGFVVGFSTTRLNVKTKLYFLLAALLVGMIGYGLIEMWEPLEVHALKIKQKMHRVKADRIRLLNWHKSGLLTGRRNARSTENADLS